MNAALLLAKLLAPVLASASPLATSLPTAQALIKGAEADIVYIDKNADKCTRNGGKLRSQFLLPLKRELADHRQALARGFDFFSVHRADCARPAQSDFAQAKEIARSVVRQIQDRERMADSPQGKFFGMSGDQVMNLALGADPSYPSCVAQQKNNPRSTLPLLAYYEMKKKLLALKRLAQNLALEADRNLRGGGKPVCRN